MKRWIRGMYTRQRRFAGAFAAVAISMGMLMLIHGHGAPVHAERDASDVAPSSMSQGASLAISRIDYDRPEFSGFLSLTQGAIGHGVQDVFAELRLEGAEAAGPMRRRPVALAVAVDVSGSMSGIKIAQAREALRALVSEMQPEDRIAVIAYSHQASVVWPLRRVGGGATREAGFSADGLLGAIARLQASGGTNIPDGLRLAAHEIQSAPDNYSRRVVLLSDGLDGSGQSVASIGRTLSTRANGGVTTSAIGIGADYDERFLSSAADAGRGNYQFLPEGESAHVFLQRELHQSASTVAEGVHMELGLPSGWHLAEVFGSQMPRESTRGRLAIGNLYAGERRRITLRFEVHTDVGEAIQGFAPVLSYRSTQDMTEHSLAEGRLTLQVVSDPSVVVASRDATLYSEANAQVLDRRQAQAIEAWRRGEVEEARRMTNANLLEVRRLRQAAPTSETLGDYEDAWRDEAAVIDSSSASNARGRAAGLRQNAHRRARSRTY